jgi:SAM-dependent methyltransferase
VQDDGYFDAEVAAHYDEGGSDEFRTEVIDASVDLLQRLAAGGPVLEFAVGTGRIAIPLAWRGVPVQGIDVSAAMVERLRAKAGGDAVGVTVGDMTTARVTGAFALVYLVFNTIMNLTSQDAQVACFRNAAAHLRPGGLFLVEVMVPDLQRLPPGQTVVPFRVDEAGIGFDQYDVVRQGLVSHHVSLTAAQGPSYRSIPFRYVWPSELDLMAQLAGMRLRDRWGGWQGEPFTAGSSSHISVWEKPS